MTLDPQSVTEILRAVAQEEILPRFQALGSGDIKQKESGELVTVADVAAEHAISRQLLALLPGSLIVGEEGVDEDPTRLEALNGAAPVWLIDPIDGTGNFANGRPVFAVMVALVRGGETLDAWIYDPITDQILLAEKGAGAYLNGRRLKLEPAAPLDRMTGTLHAGQFAAPAMARQIDARRGQLNTRKTMRCAGQEYIRLATGELQFSLFTKMKPWDHAPGTLIQSEAGGVALTLDARPYGPARATRPGLLMAPDRDSWQQIFDILFGDTDLDSLSA